MPNLGCNYPVRHKNLTYCGVSSNFRSTYSKNIVYSHLNRELTQKTITLGRSAWKKMRIMTNRAERAGGVQLLFIT